MKIPGYSLLFSILAFSAGPAQAQEGGDAGFSPMVLVGALSASVSLTEVEFANLPSGNVIRISEDGTVEVVSPDDATGADPSVPRVDSGMVSTLSDAEQDAIKQRLQGSFTALLAAYDQGSVAEEDVLAVAKFLLDADLPWDEVFKEEAEDRFGPLVDDVTDDDAVDFGLDDDDDDPTQVTDPLDTTDDYFTP